MEENNKDDMDSNYFTEDERLFIQLLQENITRMNTNSMNCKMMCVTFVGAVIALVASGLSDNLLWVAFAVTIGCYFFDVSYLRLEKNFRCLEKRFIDDIKNGAKADNRKQLLLDFRCKELKTKKTNIFREEVVGAEEVLAEPQNWRDAFCSWSTCPVYAIILIAILIIVLMH